MSEPVTMMTGYRALRVMRSLLYGEAAQRWQHQVEDDEVCRPLFEHVEGRRAVVHFDDVEARETKCRAVHPSYRNIVFHDQHGLALHCAS
jgi:hypothetical protein